MTSLRLSSLSSSRRRDSAFSIGFSVKMRRNRRQMREGPLAALDLLLLRHADLEQVADRRRQDVTIALEVVVVAREAAQRARDVGGDGRLFGNDQALGHRWLTRISGQKGTADDSKDRAARNAEARVKCVPARRTPLAPIGTAHFNGCAGKPLRAAARPARELELDQRDRHRARAQARCVRPGDRRPPDRARAPRAPARRRRRQRRPRPCRRSAAEASHRPQAPALPSTSCAVSTSLAPSLISRWLPLENGEWIEPGIANTSRPCSAAKRARDQRAAVERRLDHQDAAGETADHAIAARKIARQRRRAQRELRQQAAFFGQACAQDRDCAAG